jgi:hypothetical protein
MEREDVMTLFPKFIGPPLPEFKLSEIKNAEGKTIRSVEFGRVESHPKVHQSEEIVFHFTDDSSMAIIVGSNVRNLSEKFSSMKPNDFSVDLMIFWAPSIRRK